MAKEKLFTPEDFDKPKPRKKKSILWVLICSAIAALAVGIAAIVKSCDTQKEIETVEQKQTEQVRTGTETQVSNDGSEVAETGNSSEVTENELVEEQTTSSVPEAEIPKEQVKQEVARPNPATQPINVSDNIEQEAMNVIRGDYGNVPERREKLGSKYQEIQNRVNQLKKEGVF